MPMKWAEFHKLLGGWLHESRNVARKLLNPLILSGWSFSTDLDKRERFIGHLIVAEQIGRLDDALAWLSELQTSDWLRPGAGRMIREFQRHVLYITGRGGSLETGFASLLDIRCIDSTGRALDAEFFRMPHQAQVELIVDEVTNRHEDSVIVAHSFGAFLLLCGLSKAEISLRDVWFLSPITGSSFFKGRYFKPAGGRLVQSTIESCNFPGDIENFGMIVGEKDEQCDPERCLLLAAAFKGRGTVIPGEGHRIAPLIVEREFDTFLSTVDGGYCC